MSGTYAVAHQVFEMYREEYPDMTMTLIDSQGGCGGTSLAAIQALNMLDKGHSHEEVAHALQEIVSVPLPIPSRSLISTGSRKAAASTKQPVSSAIR